MKDKDILGFFKAIIKEVLEEALVIERSEYLKEKVNTKGNGYYRRNLKTILGEIEDLSVPRTRDGEFRSELLPYRDRSTSCLDELIQAMILSGLSTRKIGEVLTRLYGYKLSPTTVSKISEVSVEKIESWRKRQISERYAVLFIDSFFFPLKRDSVEKEAIYLVLGLKPDGYREVLGYWLPGGAESSKNWDEIFKELKERGLREVDFIVADELSGLEEVIASNFPGAIYQRCVVHILRNIAQKVRVNDRNMILEDFKKVYKSLTKEEAYDNWNDFRIRWGKVKS